VGSAAKPRRKKFSKFSRLGCIAETAALRAARERHANCCATIKGDARRQNRPHGTIVGGRFNKNQVGHRLRSFERAGVRKIPAAREGDSVLKKYGEREIKRL